MRKQHWALFVLAVVGVVLAGCQGNFQERMGWSPDGKKLAIVVNGDLCLWRESDKVPLSLLKEGVQSVTWLPDSKDVLVTRRRFFDNAEQVLATASPIQSAYIVVSAGSIREPLKRVHGDLTKLKTVLPDWESLPMVSEAITFVVLGGGEEMKQAVGEHYKELAEKVEEIYLQRYSLNAVEAIPGPVLYRVRGSFGNVRVSKDGRYALCLSYSDNPERFRNLAELVIIDLIQNREVMALCGVGPTADWCADSKSIVFLNDVGSSEGPICKSFGQLVREKIVGDKGELWGGRAPKDNEEILAGVRVGMDDRLRCLDDGAVMLCTDSLQLPSRPDDPSCADLFLIKNDVPMNRMLTSASRSKYQQTLNYFELNPGGSRAVLVGTDSVSVLDLRRGSIKELKLPDDFHLCLEFNLMPSWKSDDELVFMVDCGKSEKEHIPALMQMSITDGKSQILSKGWPKKLLESLATGDK